MFVCTKLHLNHTDPHPVIKGLVPNAPLRQLRRVTGGIMDRPIAMAAALAALLAGAAPAAAQGPPDPATIELPDLTPSRDPEVIANGGKHYYFHKAGVGYAEAYED